MADGARTLMTKFLASTRTLVNSQIDESLSHRQDCGVTDESTLAGRVQWILADLAAKEGKTISARELARRAGLKSEAHVGLLTQGRLTRPSAQMLEAIARAGGVRLEWLSSGKLPRETNASSPTISSDRIHPVIAAVAAAARYTDHEAELASTSIRGLAGTSSMTEEQALEFLARARMTIRDNARALAAPAPAPTPVVEDAPSALEELGGGKGSLPRASRGRRR